MMPPSSTWSKALRSAANWLLKEALSLLPDAWFLRVNFMIRVRRRLNLKNPQNYSDKIQWLMLHAELELYRPYTDKYEVRRYVRNTIGQEYLIPLLGIWDNFDDVPFDAMPSQFVLKATHGSGYNYVCTDKASLDFAELKRTVKSWMNSDFYRWQRERQYRYIRPRLIAETYLEDESGELRDYKFPCFGGEPYFVQVLGDRASGTTESFYDLQWNLLNIREEGYPNSDKVIARPAALADMVWVAAQLAVRFPFVRVDLYCVDGKVYFGELTFTPACGLIRYVPSSVDLELGRMLDLGSFPRRRSGHSRQARVASRGQHG